MRTKTQKPLIKLEQECSRARLANLIDSLIYNPLIERPYILVRFYESTPKATKDAVRSYILNTYDVVSAEFFDEDTSLYIEYDFWKRFPSDD